MVVSSLHITTLHSLIETICLQNLIFVVHMQEHDSLPKFHFVNCDCQFY